MGNQLSGGVLRRASLVAAGAAALACAVPAVSGAAVTPVSRTGCQGTLTPDASGSTNSDPNLLDYSFHCNGGITAYTLIGTQAKDPAGAFNDFMASPSVLENDGVTPSSTETVSCEGVLPSDGINCNTGAYGAQISDGYYVQGTIDLAQPYCKHLPTTGPDGKGAAKPGMLAIPTARVQLVVTDYTGAEDGPVKLNYTKTCATVPNQVPEPVVVTKKKTSKKTTSKKTTTKKSSVRRATR